MSSKIYILIHDDMYFVGYTKNELLAIEWANEDKYRHYQEIEEYHPKEKAPK